MDRMKAPVTETMCLINNTGPVMISPFLQMLQVIHGNPKEQVCEF
jgi:hypothetical protein